MDHLFFNLNGDLDTVSESVFNALGLGSPQQGESANLFGGSYADQSVFGVSIRLEENSYEYEDQFRFMISIKRNPLSDVSVSDEIVTALAEVARELLVLNLGVPIAMERGAEIVLFLPKA